MEKLIKFSVNDWGDDDAPQNFPINLEPLEEEERKNTFWDDSWCKANKLCVLIGLVDMSLNYTVVAPATWVSENCPMLLGSCFVYDEEEDSDRFYQPFLDYCSENFGTFMHEEMEDGSMGIRHYEH